MSSLLGIPPGHGLIYTLVYCVTGVLLLALFVRAILSWVRIDERYAAVRFLAYITDPFITPLRRIVPPMGFLDVAFILAFFLLIVLRTLLLQALPPGW